jgi:membrane protein required for colicin V production
MTGFDIAIIIVVVLSTVLAMARGVVRELVALAAWFVGLAAAISFSGVVAEHLDWMDVPPLARELLAFVLILVLVLIAGALTGALLRGAVRAIGLRFLDRFLGGVFGLMRGVLAVLVGVLLAGITALPQRDWWQNSMFGPALGVAALSLRPYLPPEWASRLNYSVPLPAPAGNRSTARFGSHGAREQCAES